MPGHDHLAAELSHAQLVTHLRAVYALPRPPARIDAAIRSTIDLQVRSAGPNAHALVEQAVQASRPRGSALWPNAAYALAVAALLCAVTFTLIGSPFRGTFVPGSPIQTATGSMVTMPALVQATPSTHTATPTEPTSTKVAMVPLHQPLKTPPPSQARMSFRPTSVGVIG